MGGGFLPAFLKLDWNASNLVLLLLVLWVPPKILYLSGL